MKWMLGYAMVGLLLCSSSVQAQVFNVVKWTFSAKPVADKAGIYEVRMTASIQPGWAIYSQETPKGGPFPTTITFNKNTNVQYGGKVKEVGAMKKKYEKVFGVDVHYFENKVDFVQLVKSKKGVPTKLSGTVEFMACDAMKCLPPDEVEFEVELK